MPPILHCMGLSIVQDSASMRMRWTCDSCRVRIYAEHYQCLQCDSGNFELCMDCVRDGIACRSTSHEWIKRTIEEGIEGRRMTIGSKIASTKARTLETTYPAWFTPPRPDDTPDLLFAEEHRFIRKSNPREILIYTDGACLGNGQSNPRAGWCFVYRPSAFTQSGVLTHGGTVWQRLESRGPTDQLYNETSNRAELRAVIAALQFIDWSTDCNGGWRRLVIATDSEYVAVNITQRIQHWEAEGWKTLDHNGQRSQDIKNQDLWKLLLSLVRALQAEGVEVLFWRIPRAWNERADKFAKEGAANRGISHFMIYEYEGPISSTCKPYQYHY